MFVKLETFAPTVSASKTATVMLIVDAARPAWVVLVSKAV